MAFPELEKNLNDWVLDCRKNGHIVTRSGIRLQSHKLAGNGASNFHASSG